MPTLKEWLLFIPSLVFTVVLVVVAVRATEDMPFWLALLVVAAGVLVMRGTLNVLRQAYKRRRAS